ncbi:MAG: hypothetical protein JXR94_21980 [Candidatus Hydrogenedentes bacterium]|nr:hypothetical protein [Candidatus Hydrogenedentota bacterium]
MATSGCVRAGSMAGLLPGEVEQWRPAEPDGLYDADTLYEYIDGAAEVYRALNVRAVVGRRYARDGEPDILADVFDMGSSEDAYGAYHHDVREGEDAGIGQESEYLGGSLTFWKGRYFVCIMPFDETEAVRRAVLALGEAIASRIPGEGWPPGLLDVLPQAGLRPGRVHYFHDHHLLNSRRFIAQENVLHLGPDTEGVLASYGTGADAKATTLILIRYPSAAGARNACGDFVRTCLPGMGADGVSRQDNGLWAGARQEGRLFAGVLDAPAPDDVTRLLDEVFETQQERGGRAEARSVP